MCRFSISWSQSPQKQKSFKVGSFRLTSSFLLVQASDAANDIEENEPENDEEEGDGENDERHGGSAEDELLEDIEEACRI